MAKSRRKTKKITKLLILVLIIALIIGGYILYDKVLSNKPTKVKTVDEIPEYGYKLTSNKPKEYINMFQELKDILSKETVNYEDYASKISEMFIYDFFSLDYKKVKTDVGGVDFIHPAIVENFVNAAEKSYYKYIENDIYGNRKQDLPRVDKVKITLCEKTSFSYKENNKKVTDDEAYKVEATWTYKGSTHTDYQSSTTIIIVHKDKKLYLVEMTEK